MLKISKPLTSATTKTYWAQAYTSVDERYYSQKGEAQGYWHGKLAEQFGLEDGVTKEHFDRLADGQHPKTAEQLVKHRNVEGIASHRSAWDLTIAPHKSISAAALVGGDERLIQAHRAAVRVTLDAIEQYTQARLRGGVNENSPNIAVAVFEHTTSRPVNGVPDPHLHSHLVAFNMTRTTDGKIRSIDPREWFKIQSYATAIYQSEMAVSVQRLGYEIERGKNFSAGIKGYTPEYLESISRRTVFIEAEKERLGMYGAQADHNIAHRNRESKVEWDPAELKAQHRADSVAMGIEPDAIPNAARARIGHQIERVSPDDAIAFAKNKLIERASVFDHYEVIREALRYGQGSLRRQDVEAAFRAHKSEFQTVEHYRGSAPGARYTTPEQMELERQTIVTMRAGIGKAAAITPKLSEAALRQKHEGRLNDGQLRTVYGVLTSRDRILGVQGLAGSGKSTALKPLREIVQQNGYEIIGLAPTSGAAKELRSIGVNDSGTLQKFLTNGRAAEGAPRMYFLDESSLASTKQVHDFLGRIRPQDRVLLIGDIRQHQSVEAGRIFEELQEAGMSTYEMNQIVRQKDPHLLDAVQSFARGDVRDGLRKLDLQGRISEHANQAERMEAIAAEYAKSPQGTLVVSPDNQSRQLINAAIRDKLRATGQLSKESYQIPILVPRQDLSKEDLFNAFSYSAGDVVKYAKGNQAVGVKAGDRATVSAIGDKTITVRRQDGQEVEYDPKQAKGVQLFTTEQRSFSQGDRIMFTAPWKSRSIANREMATITKLDSAGNVRAKLDSGRTVSWNLKQMANLDHGYASTSYSSQGITVDRVLVHVAVEHSRVQKLVDQTLGYVALSRPRYEARVFVDSKQELANALGRTHEAAKALSREEITVQHEHKQDFSLEMGG